MKTNEILKIAVEALDSKKAADIQAIEVGDLTILTEYFIIANGTSSTHVRSLAEEVEFKLSQAGLEPHHIEGKATGWILLDYDTVIVHVFTADAREFYSLDKQWQDGKIIDISEFIAQQGE
ncbi:MAG: ribosome silencing factor [Clostridia bacterium]|nr:ribosome silencing factor [Clostridia bacterium]